MITNVYFMYNGQKFSAHITANCSIKSEKGLYTSLRQWLACEYPGRIVPSVSVIRMDGTAK